jgi:hypothetical protein
VNERNNMGVACGDNRASYEARTVVLGYLLALSCGIVWRPEFYAFISGVLRA